MLRPREVATVAVHFARLGPPIRDRPELEYARLTTRKCLRSDQIRIRQEVFTFGDLRAVLRGAVVLTTG
jgi:hypothetical protein